MLLRFLENRGQMTVWDVLWLLLGYAAVIFLSMPVHESAHALVAHWCGDDTAKWHGRISLNPFAHMDLMGTLGIVLVGIGYAKPVPVITRNLRHYRRDMLLISLAGPVSNLLMAIAAVGLFRLCSLFVTSEVVRIALEMVLVNIVAGVNISLMVFNLLPIPPLDGSRLWSTLLPGKWSYVLEQYSRYITMGLFVLLFTGVLDGPLIFLNSVFMQGIFALFGMA